MKPIDHRNTTWQAVREHLAGRRLAVYAELARLGPCTTRELAFRSGMDILTVRPRVTELLELGFAGMVTPDDPAKPGKEGQYYAIAEAEALQAFLARQSAAATGQLALKISA